MPRLLHMKCTVTTKVQFNLSCSKEHEEQSSCSVIEINIIVLFIVFLRLPGVVSRIEIVIEIVIVFQIAAFLVITSIKIIFIKI